MTWDVVPAKTLFDRYAKGWDYLQRKYCGPNPVLDIRFLQSALKYFADNQVPPRLAVLHESGEPVGMALVEQCGIGQWQSFLPSQVPLGPLLLRRDLKTEAVATYLKELLPALPSYAWSVSLLNQDPAYFPIRSAQDIAGGKRLHYATTVNIEMEGSFDDYWRARSRNLRKKMRRLLRRVDLERCRLVEVRGSSALERAVAEHGRLESAGWKSAHDTAIHKNNIQGRFYREVLQKFAEQDEAVAFQLWIRDRIAASQIAIRQDGVLALLKTTHDETLRRHSPGRLLDYLMLQKLFDVPGLDLVEFYTKASREDRRWSTGHRDIYHFSYFRSRLFREATEIVRRIRRVVLPG